MQTTVTLTMNPTLDKNATIDHVVPERKLRCHALRHEPGGGGINVSRAIQKLGGESQSVYLSGGATGQTLRNLLDEEDFNHQPISIAGWTREGLTVLEKATKQQFRFNLPGPTVQAEEWRQCLDKVAALDPAPDYLVASGSLPPGVPDEFYARLARWARDNERRFILDTSSEAAMRLALQEGVYLIKPNLREFRQLVDSELELESEQEAQAKEIVEQGQSKVVVVSLGAAGVILVSKEGCERHRAPTVHIESKVGAGDSMVAGIVLSLARSKPLRAAVRFGIAAGAAAVMTPGTELCRREDTEQLYENITSNENEQGDQQ
jgi:6-phosphofructokinase 2